MTHKRLRRFYAPAVLVFITFLAYSGTFTLPFVFDDEGAILANPTIRQLSTAMMPPTEGVAVQRRPIVNLSLAVNYAISGTDVWSYHVFNLIAHAWAALLLFGIVRRTLPDKSTWTALAVASLWAIHPLLTDAVTCVCQRTEVLAGLFSLLTLYCLIRGWYLGAITACGLAMGCKESVLALPIIAVMYDRLFVEKPWRERWMIYCGLALTWTIPIVLLPYGNEGAAVFGQAFESVDYALAQFGAITHYLYLCFWPSSLVIDYGYQTPISSMQVVPYLLAITLLMAGIAIAWRYQPWLGFLGICFFLILAPSSSVIPCANNIAAEKRMYLPLIAVVIPVVLLARRLRCPAWVGPFAVLLLATLTFERNLEYTNEFSIWTDAVAKQPDNPRAYNNLGVCYGRAGLYQDAAVYCYKAITMEPNYADAYRNLGLAFDKLGKRDKASACYQLAEKYRPAKKEYPSRKCPEPNRGVCGTFESL